MTPYANNQRIGNTLLERFPVVLREQLISRARQVQLRHHQSLYVPHRAPGSVYFPLACLISLFAVLEDGQTIGFETIGPDGMLGVYTVLVGALPSFEAIVQAPGPALQVDIAWFRDAIATREEARNLLWRYACFLTRYMAQQAICSAAHRVEQRCCRWLLASSHQLRTDLLPLTHEELALMLGVRRPAVTTILGQLQREGLIRQHRGSIKLVDEAALRVRACECFEAVRI